MVLLVIGNGEEYQAVEEFREVYNGPSITGSVFRHNQMLF